MTPEAGNAIAEAFALAAFYGAFATAAACLLWNQTAALLLRRRMLARAMEAGHAVEAALRKWLDADSSEADIHPGYQRGRGTTAIYEYEWKGRRYRYRKRFMRHAVPDRTVRLYFRRHPSKAREERLIGQVEREWVLAYPASVLAIAAWILIAG